MGPMWLLNSRRILNTILWGGGGHAFSPKTITCTHMKEYHEMDSHEKKVQSLRLEGLQFSRIISVLVQQNSVWLPNPQE